MNHLFYTTHYSIDILTFRTLFLNFFVIAGQRTITVDPTFFPGYRKTSLLPNEVLVSVLFPFTKKVHNIVSKLIFYPQYNYYYRMNI